MIDTPNIVRVEDQHYAFIRLTIPRSEIHAVLPATLRELQSTVSEKGLPANLPWFAHHLTLSDGDFDFEVCLPVDQAFPVTGRIHPGLWPAGEVARTVYHGDYPGVLDAWKELHSWIQQSGRSYAGHIYERYVGNQGNTPNPADYRTELSWPVIAKVAEGEPS